MPLPLIKFGVLLVRTISKPIAAAMKERAKHSPAFEKFAVNFAQAYHQGDVRLRRRLLGYKTEEVRALDKDKAIELGASIVGEATVLLVACAAVSFEWLRGRGKDSAKEAKLDERFQTLANSISGLEERVNVLKAENDILKQELEKKNAEKSDSKLTKWIK